MRDRELGWEGYSRGRLGRVREGRRVLDVIVRIRFYDCVWRSNLRVMSPVVKGVGAGVVAIGLCFILISRFPLMHWSGHPHEAFFLCGMLSVSVAL